MQAYITYYGAKGGRQSARRPLEILDLSDGSSRIRFGLGEVPVRAAWAEIEIQLDPPIWDQAGNPILDNVPTPVRRIA